MTRSEATDKIRKLLHTKGRTEAEADTATIIAAALAAKHNIDIAELDQADRNREIQIIHQCFGQWTAMPDEATYASLICRKFFEVSPFESGRHFLRIMIVVGTEQHLTIARYVFDFLMGEFRRAWNRRPNKRIKKRKAFMHGIFQALFTKLYFRFEDTKPPQLELALEISFKARRNKYISENFGEMGTSAIKPRNIANAAANAGWQAGQNIEIRPAVEPADAPAGQLREPSKLLTN